MLFSTLLCISDILVILFQRFHNAIEVPESVRFIHALQPIRLFACLLPFRASSCALSSTQLLGSREHFLTTLSDECDTALDVLDRVHADLKFIVNDFWKRFDDGFVLDNDPALKAEHIRRVFANFTCIARGFFAFATVAEYKATSFHLPLSRVQEAAENLLA